MSEPLRAGLEPSDLPSEGKGGKALAAAAPAAGAHAAAAAPAQAVARASAGKLHLSTRTHPPSKVLVDGRAVGLTPKVGISVAAGTHTVIFVSDRGRKTSSATCKAGERKTVAIRF